MAYGYDADFSNTAVDPTRRPQYGGGGGKAPGALNAAAMFAPPGVGMALGFAGNVASWLGGRGQRKKNEAAYAADRSNLTKLAGEQFFNPLQVDALARNTIYSDVEGMGGQLDRNFDLDTGGGAGALREGMLSARRKSLINSILMNEMATGNRKTNIYGQLANQSARRLEA